MKTQVEVLEERLERANARRDHAAVLNLTGVIRRVRARDRAREEVYSRGESASARTWASISASLRKAY